MPRLPILGSATKPESPVYPSNSSDFLTNNLLDAKVYVFPDGTTRERLAFSVGVEKASTGTPNLVLVCATQSTTDNVVIDVELNQIADGDDIDPSSYDIQVSKTQAIPGTADTRFDIVIPLTGLTLASGDEIKGWIVRDKTDVNDDLSDNLLQFKAYLDYTGA